MGYTTGHQLSIHSETKSQSPNILSPFVEYIHHHISPGHHTSSSRRGRKPREAESGVQGGRKRSRQSCHGVRRGVRAQLGVPPHVRLRGAPAVLRCRRRRHHHPLLGSPIPALLLLVVVVREAAAAGGGGADPRLRGGHDVAVGGAGGPAVPPLRPGGPHAPVLRRLRHARPGPVRRLPGRRPRRAPHRRRTPPGPRQWRRRPPADCARGGHQLRRARGVPPRSRAARQARGRWRRQGGALLVRRGQGRRRRSRAGGQGRRGGGDGADRARRHQGAAPPLGHRRAPPAQVHPRVPPPRLAPEVFRAPKRGQDSAHQRHRHRGRLPAHSSSSGRADHLGRARPDLPSGESAQNEGEARGEGGGEGDPEHGAPASSGGPEALQPHPPRLPPAALALTSDVAARVAAKWSTMRSSS